MRRLKILKHENSIMELSIANGLIFILKENQVPFELENVKGAYLIHIPDELDFDELVFPEIDLERFLKSSNSSFNKTENENFYNNYTNLILGQDDENLALTFKYFETLDTSYLDKGTNRSYPTTTGEMKVGLNIMTKVKMIGTRSYSRGIRGLSTASPSQVSDIGINVVLSILGFLTSTNYLKIGKDMELNMMYIPKKTDDLIIPKFKTYISKETGEVVDLTNISNVSKIVALAELYLISIKKLNSIHLQSAYEGIYIPTLKPSGNKPMADKMLKLPILNVSNDFLDKFCNLLTWSSVNLDVKSAIAEYFLNQNLVSFLKMIHVLGKDNKTIIRKNILKELINLQIDKVKYIYGLKSLVKLGRGLNRLIESGKGFSIQVELLNCTEIQPLVKIIEDICFLYTRSFKSPTGKGYKLINSKELMEIILAINTIDDVKVVAGALITYSSIYIEANNNEEVEEEKKDLE